MFKTCLEIVVRSPDLDTFVWSDGKLFHQISISFSGPSKNPTSDMMVEGLNNPVNKDTCRFFFLNEERKKNRTD